MQNLMLHTYFIVGAHSTDLEINIKFYRSTEKNGSMRKIRGFRKPTKVGLFRFKPKAIF
jgi:hypothetical protein